MSTNGGYSGKWRRDGRELYYLAEDGALMAAEVNTAGATFEVAEVRQLFPTRTAGARAPYAVSANGQRFLVITATDEAVVSPLTLLVNWTGALNR